MYAAHTESGALDNVHFDGNEAIVAGGGLAVRMIGKPKIGSLDVSKSLFDKNYATFGGAVHASTHQHFVKVYDSAERNDPITVAVTGNQTYSAPYRFTLDLSDLNNARLTALLMEIDFGYDPEWVAPFTWTNESIIMRDMSTDVSDILEAPRIAFVREKSYGRLLKLDLYARSQTTVDDATSHSDHPADDDLHAFFAGVSKVVVYHSRSVALQFLNLNDLINSMNLNKQASQTQVSIDFKLYAIADGIDEFSNEIINDGVRFDLGIADTVIDNNEANSFGGALFSDIGFGHFTATMAKTNITRNTAPIAAGIAMWSYDPDTSPYDVDDGTFIFQDVHQHTRLGTFFDALDSLRFSGNRAQDAVSSASFSYANVSLANGAFVNEQVDHGFGVAHFVDSHAQLSNIKVKSTSTQFIGGLVVEHSFAQIRDSEFTQNTVSHNSDANLTSNPSTNEGRGASIYVTDIADFTMVGSESDLTDLSDTPVIEISDCTFTDNSADNGGAVYFDTDYQRRNEDKRTIPKTVSESPTRSPTKSPSASPSKTPSRAPTRTPTHSPTQATAMPTFTPTTAPFEETTTTPGFLFSTTGTTANQAKRRRRLLQDAKEDTSESLGTFTVNIAYDYHVADLQIVLTTEPGLSKRISTLLVDEAFNFTDPDIPSVLSYSWNLTAQQLDENRCFYVVLRDAFGDGLNYGEGTWSVEWDMEEGRVQRWSSYSRGNFGYREYAQLCHSSTADLDDDANLAELTISASINESSNGDTMFYVEDMLNDPAMFDGRIQYRVIFRDIVPGTEPGSIGVINPRMSGDDNGLEGYTCVRQGRYCSSLPYSAIQNILAVYCLWNLDNEPKLLDGVANLTFTEDSWLEYWTTKPMYAIDELLEECSLFLGDLNTSRAKIGMFEEILDEYGNGTEGVHALSITIENNVSTSYDVDITDDTFEYFMNTDSVTLCDIMRNSVVNEDVSIAYKLCRDMWRAPEFFRSYSGGGRRDLFIPPFCSLTNVDHYTAMCSWGSDLNYVFDESSNGLDLALDQIYFKFKNASGDFDVLTAPTGNMEDVGPEDTFLGIGSTRFSLSNKDVVEIDLDAPACQSSTQLDDSIVADKIAVVRFPAGGSCSIVDVALRVQDSGGRAMVKLNGVPEVVPKPVFIYKKLYVNATAKGLTLSEFDSAADDIAWLLGHYLHARRLDDGASNTTNTDADTSGNGKAKPISTTRKDDIDFSARFQSAVVSRRLNDENSALVDFYAIIDVSNKTEDYDQFTEPRFQKFIEKVLEFRLKDADFCEVCEGKDVTVDVTKLRIPRSSLLTPTSSPTMQPTHEPTMPSEQAAVYIPVRRALGFVKVGEGTTGSLKAEGAVRQSTPEPVTGDSSSSSDFKQAGLWLYDTQTTSRTRMMVSLRSYDRFDNSLVDYRTLCDTDGMSGIEFNANDVAINFAIDTITQPVDSLCLYYDSQTYRVVASDVDLTNYDFAFERGDSSGQCFSGEATNFGEHFPLGTYCFGTSKGSDNNILMYMRRIYEPVSRSVKITGATFDGNVATNDGGALSIGGNNGVNNYLSLTLSQGTFVNNVAGLHGASIAVFAAFGDESTNADTDYGAMGVITIDDDTNFAHNMARYGGAISLMMDFDGNDDGNVFKSLVQVSHSLIEENNATSFGGATYVYGGNIVIDNTEVDRNTAINGGGVWMVGAQFAIVDSVVKSNKAHVGGGGLYRNHYPVTSFAMCVGIHNTKFTNNSAQTGGGVFMNLKGNTDTLGGNNEDCVKFSDARIVGNRATKEGAEVFLNISSGEHSILNPDTAVSALCGGNFTGCVNLDSTLRYLCLQETDITGLCINTYAKVTLAILENQEMSQPVELTLVPGSSALISAYGWNGFGNKMTNTEFNIALKSDDGPVQVTAIAPGSDKYHWLFPLFVEAGSVGQTGTVTVSDPGNRADPINVTVDVVACDPGYFQNNLSDAGDLFTCEPCPYGQYNMGNWQCESCPEGIACKGLNNTEVLMNWYSYPRDQGKLGAVNCPPGYCCRREKLSKGGNLDENGCYIKNKAKGDLCAPNRNADIPMCGKCDKGFSETSSSSGDCQVCNSSSGAWIFFLPNFFGFLIILFFFRQGKREVQTQSHPFVTYITKSALYVFQLIPYLSFREVSSSIEPIARLANLKIEVATSENGDCILRNMGARTKILLELVPGLFLGFQLIAIYGALKFYQHRRLRGRPLPPSWKNGFNAAVWNTLFTIYTQVTGALIKLTTCQPYQDELRMYYAGDVTCPDVYHGLCYVGLLGCFLFPFVLLAVLALERRRGGQTYLRVRYPSMILPYRRKCWWFSSWSLLRRFMIVMLASIPASNTTVIASVVSLFVAFVLATHLYLQPMHDQQNNSGETYVWLIALGLAVFNIKADPNLLLEVFIALLSWAPFFVVPYYLRRFMDEKFPYSFAFGKGNDDRGVVDRMTGLKDDDGGVPYYLPFGYKLTVFKEQNEHVGGLPKGAIYTDPMRHAQALQHKYKQRALREDGSLDTVDFVTSNLDELFQEHRERKRRSLWR
jgi:hypothetical protein